MKNVWREKGFDDFRGGRFGNAGHNIYVSRAGVLQRIHQYNFSRSGYVDLVFCNSHSHCELPPAYVYTDPLNDQTPQNLLSDNAVCGTVADLNGDGCDDLVLGMWYNGIRRDLNSFIYYGSPEGYSERRHLLLPTPACRSVAAGDFNGDGKPDLAFLLESGLRIFYQSDLGFEPKRFVDLPIKGVHIAADDLDGDGFADVVVRAANGDLTICWGGPRGIDPRCTRLLKAEGSVDSLPLYYDQSAEPVPLARIIRLGGVPHLFMPLNEKVLLFPVRPDRSVGEPLTLHCAQAMAIATGDVNGDGHTDIVVACREPHGKEERSWIYWGGAEGYDESRRSPLRSSRACDVAVADLDGDGCDEVVLCQSHTKDYYTCRSLVYRGSPAGPAAEPIELPSEDPRRVLLARPSGKGRPQVILANRYGESRIEKLVVPIYLGGPDGYSESRRLDIGGWGAVEAIYADLNDDGLADLVLANAAEGLVGNPSAPDSFVFFNGPQGLPSEHSLKLPVKHAHGGCCADIDRDGYLDLLFCGIENQDITIFHGSAQGFDVAHPERIRLEHGGILYKGARWICLADLNNDGWLDLVIPDVSGDRNFILWGGPNGFSMKNAQVLSAERVICARAADLTGNGYLDLILGGHSPTRGLPHDSFAYVYWNGPDGLRQDRRTMLPAAGINSMAVADFNNDGMLDLFIGSYEDWKDRDIDSYIYWNRKGRGFSAQDCTRLATHSASGCLAADFNEDGWVDLAVANHKIRGNHVGYSEVWWNGPDGFDKRRTTKLPTQGPHGMTATEPGNIADRGPEEYYESSAFKLPGNTAPTKISWQAETPAKTWVKAQLRCADTKEKLQGAPWVGPAGPGTWFNNHDEVQGRAFAGKWIAYRLALGATNSVASPRVTEVAVEYEG